MGALTSPGGLAVVGVVLVLLIGVLVLGGLGGGTAARDALVKRGRYGEAARMAADAGDFAVAFDLYLRAQEPENAAAIAVKRGDLRQAAELYERAANWERAVHFYQRAGMGPKADDLRAARLAPAPAPRPRGDSDAPRSRAHELEARYRQAASAGATTDAAKVELQRQAGDAADALLAEGELARAAEIYADAGLEDEAVHLYVNVLGQPGRAAPLVARRGNHQRAAELFELAGELERAAVAWVDVAKGSPRPDSFLERIGELSPKVALGYVEQELGGRPLSKATAEWHYQRAKLTAAGGDAARAQEYFEQLQAIVGPYRDVEERLRGLALPAPAPAPRARTMQGPGSNLDPTQIELLASQVAEAAAQQLKRRVELSALPDRFTLIDGTVDTAAVEDAVGPARNDIWSLGTGDDFESAVDETSPARPLGIPVRMAMRDDLFVVTPSSDMAGDFVDGEHLGADEAFTAVAEQLDAAHVYGAYLTSVREGRDGSPFDTIGMGVALDDEGPSVVIVYHYADDATASDAVADVEAVLEGDSLRTGQPWSETFSSSEVTAEGSNVVATLRLASDRSPAIARQILFAGDSLVDF